MDPRVRVRQRETERGREKERERKREEGGGGDPRSRRPWRELGLGRSRGMESSMKMEIVVMGEGVLRRKRGW